MSGDIDGQQLWIGGHRMTDEEIDAAMDATTPEEWAALDDDLRDLEQTDPAVAAAARAYEEMQDRIRGDVGPAIAAASDAELVEFRAMAIANKRYMAAQRLEAEIDRRHRERFPLEQWSTPRPGAKPNRRRCRG